MKRALLILIALAGWSTSRADEWLEEVEFRLDPPEDGKQILSARFTPNRTLLYDALEFDCIYRQEIPWRDAAGKPQTKVVEPVAFTYRRKEVKMTAALDFHCSFRVPVSHEKLKAAYGERTFSPDVPVRIDRVRLRGMVGDAPVWTHEYRVPGVHAVVPPPPPPPAKTAPPGAGFGAVDLD